MRALRWLDTDIGLVKQRVENISLGKVNALGKWIVRLLGLGVLGYVGLFVFGLYQGGYFRLPDIPPGSYTVSFKSGLRGIVLDAEVTKPESENAPKYFRRLSYANPDRKYLGVPFKVAPWFEDSWSFCSQPTNEEREMAVRSMRDEMANEFSHARLDAVCRLNVDGTEIVRGLIYSVPKL